MRAFAEQRVAAMGTAAHIIVVGTDAQRRVATAIDRVFDLEQRWSRFSPTSEVTRVNTARGRAVEVSPETMSLVDHGVAAWRLTAGRFDPLMVDHVTSAGYTRSFADGLDDPLRASGNGVASVRACDDIVIDREHVMITLPDCVGFDPGGLGKGLAADIITREAMDDGAWGVLVNIGGDLTVKGLSVDQDEWVVTVTESNVDPGVITTARLQNASLATSTTRKRRWRTADGEAHHIINPTTGRSTREVAVLATVIAGEGWWAEAAATAMLVDPTTEPTEDPALLIFADGRRERRGTFESFET